jgi:hypothetical protein
MKAGQLSDVYCANEFRRKRAHHHLASNTPIRHVGTDVAHASQFPDAGVSL